MEYNFKTLLCNLDAGQTFEWYSTDSCEEYKKNLKESLPKLKSNGWHPKIPITYKFNDYGFRCDNFSDVPSVMFLGCSNTFGCGLPMESTFSHIVSQELGLANYNLGVCAGANDTSFRLGYWFIPKLKPKIVVNTFTFSHRFEVLDPDPIVIVPENIPFNHRRFYRRWISEENNLICNLNKNNLALNMICHQHNIKYVSLDMSTLWHENDKARDLMHPGVKSNISHSKKILELIAG
jgi:hypothetical protein